MPLRYILQTIDSLNRQKKFLRQFAEPILSAPPYRHIPEKDRQKIRRYYGLAVPSILGESFCALQGRVMSQQERTCSTAQGAITGLFDDFFDEGSFSEEQIRALWNHPAAQFSEDPARALFLQFFKQALDHAPDPESLMQQFRNVHAAQEQSRRQADPGISLQEIRETTWLKGGHSLLFYRTAFAPMAKEAETKAWYALGGLMQLCNDLFDVYKDREAGIHTLVIRADSIIGLRSLWLEKYREAAHALAANDYPKKNIHNTLAMLNTGIFSRSLVCLDQLQALENISGKTFRVAQYTRKQLICDMEKPKNLWKAGRYIAYLNRLGSPS